MKAYFIYSNFYDVENNSISIGGVQTYIYELSQILIELKIEVFVYQISSIPFKSIKIDGINCNGFDFKKHRSRNLYLKVKKLLNQQDMLIFGSENFSTKTNHLKSLSIQHGVFWDLDYKLLNINKLYSFLPRNISNLILFKKLIQNIFNTTDVVCVDNNYINWIRTQGVIRNFKVIPNFSKIDKKIDFNFLKEKHLNQKKIKILFARRFVKFRGVSLFLDCISELNNTFDNLEFVMAGEGPLIKLIQSKNIKNLSVKKYVAVDSMFFLKDFHISVIPSLGSEGTSITALESMATGSCVVASNVGGITNIIINKYNGLLVNPNKAELVNALAILIRNEELRLKISNQSLNIVKNALSYDDWKKEWLNLILEKYV